MKVLRTGILTAAVASMLLLAGCGSSGIGDILGGGGDGSGSAQQIRGTVDGVDVNNQFVVLTGVDSYSGLSSGGGSSARVYFDDRTTVEYQGQSYRPEDLERGDEISARVVQSGNRLVADSMTVLRNVSAGGSSGYPSGSYGKNIRGTIDYVDSSRRTLDINQGNYSGRAQITTVSYDTSTRVDYNGRTFRPEDLERGDEVEIMVADTGSSRVLARTINVIRDVNGTEGGYSGSTGTNSTVRGTVSYVDTARRTIELTQASWSSNFSTAPGKSGGVTVLQYDSNTQVEYQGRTYPPANLEQGDRIEAQVRDVGGNVLQVQRIVVLQSR